MGWGCEEGCGERVDRREEGDEGVYDSRIGSYTMHDFM
jgi:hypothetical protein